MQPKRNRRVVLEGKYCTGVTLIELLIVLAVMGILAGVAHTSYKEFIIKARRTEGKAALLQILQQQERYYSLHNSYIVFSSTSTDEDEMKFKWYSGEKPSSSAYEIFGEACPGDSIRNCLQLAAIPGTSKVNANFSDPYCGKLIATSTGAKEAGHEDCWQ